MFRIAPTISVHEYARESLQKSKNITILIHMYSFVKSALDAFKISWYYFLSSPHKMHNHHNLGFFTTEFTFERRLACLAGVRRGGRGDETSERGKETRVRTLRTPATQAKTRSELFWINSIDISVFQIYPKTCVAIIPCINYLNYVDVGEDGSSCATEHSLAARRAWLQDWVRRAEAQRLSSPWISSPTYRSTQR